MVNFNYFQLFEHIYKAIQYVANINYSFNLRLIGYLYIQLL